MKRSSCRPGRAAADNARTMFYLCEEEGLTRRIREATVDPYKLINLRVISNAFHLADKQGVCSNIRGLLGLADQTGQCVGKDRQST